MTIIMFLKYTLPDFKLSNSVNEWKKWNKDRTNSCSEISLFVVEQLYIYISRSIRFTIYIEICIYIVNRIERGSSLTRLRRNKQTIQTKMYTCHPLKWALDATHGCCLRRDSIVTLKKRTLCIPHLHISKSLEKSRSPDCSEGRSCCSRQLQYDQWM